MRRLILLVAAWLATVGNALAQTPADDGSKEATAARVSADAIRVDGRLDEEAWTRAAVVTDLVQKEPVEGAPPTERTEVRFVYSEDALFVGARMHSSQGRSGIQAPLGRRDGASGELADYILISLDSYLDRRTAYSFGVSASGVRFDHYHAADSETNTDSGFDPVWEANVSVDDAGWTAEMWIPLSQLRFNERSDHVWGLNIHRWIPAKNEDDYWVAVPRTVQAWSSRFGQLRGIQAVETSRRLEVLPYVAAGSTINGDRNPDNPFDDGLNLEGRVGADLKMGVGPNLTLDATVTPDFGQVEADPAVVNLTDFEVFFPERRPFFTEGSGLLTGPTANYFYSRRIGAPPSGPASGEFVDYPSSTTILGAAKLTGRLASGTSVGLLGAFTGEEHARTFKGNPGTVDDVRVTPRTMWGVARVQQEFGAARSTAAFMVTGTRRDLEPDDPLAALMHRNAVTANSEALWRLAGGRYEISVSGGLSYVSGERAALLRTQRASQRYFQRPDADHVELDSTRTSMSGGKFTVQASKLSGSHWLWDFFFDVESPEVEFNDLGRLGAGDGIANRQSLTYRETAPSARLRSYRITVGENHEWNFGGDVQRLGVSANASVTWNNFWTTTASTQLEFRHQDHRLTRGGPSMGTPRGWSSSISVRNSSAEQTRWSASLRHGRDELGGWNASVDGTIAFVPSPSWQISLGPAFERQVDPRQYVTARGGRSAATYGSRYIFAAVDRTTLAMEARVNFTLKPDVNLDLYAQPFAASGRYYDFGELSKARSRYLRSYGTGGTTIERLADGRHEVRDGADTFTISNRDFNVRSLRSTAVLRWEWRPGSTFYFVWQQDRSREEDIGERAGLSDVFGSLTASGNNFLAIKASYWIGG